ncbi:MAG: hypothetical protein ABIO70_33775 [Pseudomonadota bacterium]
MSAPGIAAQYKDAKIVLWVEDDLTRGYLSALWLDLDIGFRIGGGNDSIAGVAEDAWRAGYGHVFGLRDRDFSKTNRDRWSDPSPNLRCYTLETHEFENFLLDPAALHRCDQHTGGRSLAQIEDKLQAVAAGMVPWMACRRVIAELSQARMLDFPKHPKRKAIPTIEAAQSYLNASPWLTTQVHALPGLAAPAAISAQLATSHATYQAALQDGSWRQVFSGKEVFGDLRSFVHPQGKGSEAAVDLAKSVGAWQRLNHAVPAELADLRRSLRVRLGLPA